MIIFGLARFGIDCPWPHFSYVEGYEREMSLLQCQ